MGGRGVVEDWGVVEDGGSWRTGGRGGWEDVIDGEGRIRRRF